MKIDFMHRLRRAVVTADDISCGEIIDTVDTLRAENENLRTSCEILKNKADSAEARVLDPHCHLAHTGRGDCEHAVGIPGLDMDVDHDGPTTEDVYGKPNGWCWHCWHQYRIAKLERELAEARRDSECLREWGHKMEHERNESAHVILEHTDFPNTDDSWCRCDDCKAVARRIDEAGFAEGIKDLWWDDAAVDALMADEEE